MSAAALSLVLAVAFALLALVLNHVYARLAIVELTLNEGLPPGYESNAEPVSGGATVASGLVAELLGPGVHLFASRSCHACQRLLDELDAIELDLVADLVVHYIDRPRPLAKAVAERHGAVLHADQEELALRSGADPLPYTITVGPESLVSRSVSPTVAIMVETARNAGVRASVRATT